MDLPLRARLARQTARLIARGLQVTPRFQGETLPGRIALRIDPGFLSHNREVSMLHTQTVLVTGTNGKTTTTAFIRSLLGPSVVSNRGSNLPWGIASALAQSTGATPYAVLEVDEAYVPAVAAGLQPAVLVWLNMSRDQLDRNLEVRRLAARVGESASSVDTLVANASDPLIVANSANFGACVWVKGPPEWEGDAQACPRCTGELTYAETWSCTSCGLQEPASDYEVDGGGQLWHDGVIIGSVHPGLPGNFNLLNALMASVAVALVGREPVWEVASRLSLTSGVEGRFASWWLTACEGTPTLITYLAKNPAGWHANLSMIDTNESELVLGLNARIADGRDTSWIWDVEFERLQRTPTIVTGERATDLALRLEVAGFEVVAVEPSQVRAVGFAAKRAAQKGRNRIVYLGNYTAFRSLIATRAELGAVVGLTGEAVL
ncbi:Mur ligase family protein [Ferrimicrobium sp.]|uniref:Mur ligase family protein n=1 Tax=Ferrimicrobium sp. TaxID=2926050 RepID=UPI00260F3F69|nr:Mur ligase family protein [Ferrimicrobium sp.]